MGKVAFMRMCLGTQSCPTLATPWTVPPQASLSIEFSRQEYWSELPFPSPGNTRCIALLIHSSVYLPVIYLYTVNCCCSVVFLFMDTIFSIKL